MTSGKFTESTVEEAVLEWTDGLAYAVLHGPEIAPGESAGERDTFVDVLLVGRLRAAIERINPKVPYEARDEALGCVLRTETPKLRENNRRFHWMLVDGIDVEYQADGRTVHDKVWLVDFADRDNNDWLAVNVTVRSEKGAGIIGTEGSLHTSICQPRCCREPPAESTETMTETTQPCMKRIT